MRCFLAIILLGAAFSVSGCTMAYRLATDERAVGCYVDDAVITSKIRKSFIDDPLLSVFDIKVMVYRGRVVLAGVLKADHQSKRAAFLAGKVAGVRKVETYFLLGRRPGHSPKDFANDCLITGRIKAEFIADPDLRNFQIDVYTVYGHAILVGIVNSEERARRAVKHAQEVPGVSKVQSFILVGKGNSLL